MLIFVKGVYLARIASGEKTTTIRPWRTCTLRVGTVLSFNGKIRVVLTKLEHRRVRELSDQDARADGFPSRAALRAALRSHYPTLTLDRRVWVLHFAVPHRASGRHPA